MHKINLSNYDLRTDLIIEENVNNKDINSYCIDNINVDDIILNKNNKLHKKPGKYVTISYEDVTDEDNYQKVLDVFIKELNKVLDYIHISNSDKCLIVGLGNHNIISDALGSKCLENRNVAILEPNVMGVTGIDSFEIIKKVVEEIKPDFIIAIDSLCAIDIRRLNKTIQITTSGITPGSGIGNTKRELSYDTLGVKVIAIGVPTVVDSIVIVSDTINFILKKIAYLKGNKNMLDKLKPVNKINYLKEENELENSDKKEILGYIGLLNNNELKSLIWEVLSPIGIDMVVTSKEIDFLITKLSKLISNGINNALHNID